MGSLSITHWLIVLAIVSLVFGTKKIRSLGSDLGGAIKGFKEGIQESEAPAAAQPAVVEAKAETALDAHAGRTVSQHRA